MLNIFSDYHMHPQGHRVQPYNQALLQPWADYALKRGVTDIAFTDHDRYHEGIDFDEIEKLRANNPQLKVRAGIELDNDPVTSNAGRAWVEKNWDRLDFVLGSVHYLDGEDKMFDAADQECQFRERSVESVYDDYIEQLSHIISLGHIDCVSHLDLIKIHGYRPSLSALSFFHPVLELIKKSNLAMEINTAGWRKPAGEQYPEAVLAQEAIRLGIPLTLSSDAHSYAQIGEDYARLAQLLEEWQVKEVAVYHAHIRTMKLLPQS
jgi:histidinol-phosphatase (PHP family)